MSDYTPTTAVVQAMYIRGATTHRFPMAEVNAEFDRWLTQHDAEVRASAERAEAKIAAALAWVDSGHYLEHRVMRRILTGEKE